ncbi:MAG: hypothetical protein N838_30625 [Thiohalocapsa sp. PB-PSB1]|nr:MAG: hypothetical protein N838_30625 [Thiohalocapsa sp. PB-PSB1]
MQLFLRLHAPLLSPGTQPFPVTFSVSLYLALRTTRAAASKKSKQDYRKNEEEAASNVSLHLAVGMCSLFKEERL